MENGAPTIGTGYPVPLRSAADTEAPRTTLPMPRFNHSPNDPEFYRNIPKGYLFIGGGRYRVGSLLGTGTFGSVY